MPSATGTGDGAIVTTPIAQPLLFGDYGGAKRRIEKTFLLDELRIDRQARQQRETLSGAGLGELFDVRPRRLGVHVVLQ